jgi:hypothetical protein
MAKRTKKKKVRKRRTTTEKVIIVLGIIIALSMIMSLVVGLGSRGSTEGSSALPEDSSVPIAIVIESVEIDGTVVGGTTIGVPNALI